MAANKIRSCICYFSACSPHHFTLTHMLLDAFNLEMYNSSSHCSINGSHNFIFHPLMLQELHITLLAVHVRKRLHFIGSLSGHPWRCTRILCAKKCNLKTKTKQISQISHFNFLFLKRTSGFPEPKLIFYIKYLYFILKCTLLYLQKTHTHTPRLQQHKHSTCKKSAI